MRPRSFVILAFLSFCALVGIAFGNPIPWSPLDSFLHLDPIQYFSIVTAEFCALVVGTAILTHTQQATWWKAALTMLVAITVSYLLGIVIWIASFQSGLLTLSFPNPTSLAFLLMPEIIGILLGIVIIGKLAKTTWTTALTTMTAAMTTSLTIGILLAVIYLRFQLLL